MHSYNYCPSLVLHQPGFAACVLYVQFKLSCFLFLCHHVHIVHHPFMMLSLSLVKRVTNFPGGLGYLQHSIFDFCYWCVGTVT